MQSRRRFLSKAAVGGAIALASTKPIKAAANPLDVVVVGGGMSGLSAASQLTAQGHQVVLLEARARLGGRIQTDRSYAMPIDLGASWIHGPSASNPLVALAARAGLTTAVTPDDLVQLYATNGTAVPYSISDPLETRYDQLSNKVRSTASKLGKDISFQQALTSQSSTLLNDPIMRYFGAAWTEFDTGAPLNELSAMQGMEDEAFGGTDVIVTNGYDRILTPLMNGFEIRSGTPVEAIQQTATDVTVRYSGGTIKADAVVVTAPLGVLKAGAISFTPALSATKLAALGRIGFGTVNKVILEFDKATWPSGMQYYGFCRAVGQSGRACYAMNVKKLNSQTNVLVLIYTGAEALRLETLTPAQVVQEALAGIRPILGATPPQLKSSRITRWKNEIYTRGSYSFAAVGTKATDFDTLARPQGRLYFAGEHTNGMYRGTVHGAYLSGQRAATELMTALA